MVLTEYQNNENSPHEQLLNMIDPYCSLDGGLMNSNKETLDFVISAMQSCDKHDLRIIICKIIIHTDTKIMDNFLDSGAWKILSDWLQDARDAKMFSVVKELVELCHKIPMNARRLTQSTCPRTMRKLEKCSDESISKSAKYVVEKWRAIFDQSQSKSADNKTSQTTSGAKASASKSVKNVTEISSKKSKKLEESPRKRKKCDSESVSIDSNNDLKIKIKKVGRKVSGALVGGVYTDKKCDKIKTQPTLSVSSSEVTPSTVPTSQNLFRTVTTKIKPTKSRMDFLAENGTSKIPSATVTSSNKSKSTEQKTSEGIILKIKPVIKPQSVQPKTSKTGDEILKNLLPPLQVEPTPSPIVSLPSAPPKPVLKDSLSFMDAISLKAPVIRRKTIVRKDVLVSDTVSDTHAGAESKINLNKEIKSDLSKGNIVNDLKIVDEEMSDSHAPSAPKPVFNFYTDILKEAKEKKEKEKALENERKQCDSKTLAEVEKATDDEMNSLIRGDSVVTNSLDDNNGSIEDVSRKLSPTGVDGVLKGILLFGKSKQKFRVRFPSEEKLCQVKIFELDREERTNVYRNALQMKQYDMQSEANALNEARRATIHRPWTLIDWDLEGFTTFNHIVARDSIEKDVQMERNAHLLEAFYMSNNIPDSPAEPDFESVERTSEPIIISNDDQSCVLMEILPDPSHQFSNYLNPPSQPAFTNSSIPNYTPENVNNPPIYNPVHQDNNFNSVPNSQAIYNPSMTQPFGMNEYSAPPMPQPNHRPPNNDFTQFRNQTSPPCEPYNGPTNYWPDENFNGNPGPNTSGQPRGFENFGYAPRPPHSRFGNGRAGHDGPFNGPPGPRPPRDQIVCKFFARFGNCKFREKCNYKHAEPERRF